MGKLREILGRKVGGIPVLYIVGFLVIGLAIYAWQTGAVSPAAEPVTDDADPTPVDSAEGDAEGVNQPVFVANPSVPASTTAQIDTNELWLRRAAEWLANNGGVTSQRSFSVLNKYLAAETLSYDERQLADTAIKQFGLPPEPPDSYSTTAKPASRQFSEFPGVHVIKGTSDNSYKELTQLYYGQVNKDSVDLLQYANPALGKGSGVLPVGTKVKIPAYRPAKYYTATSATRTSSAIARNNGISEATLANLNDGMKFPVRIGTRVRVA